MTSKLVAVLALAAGACGGRSDDWSLPVESSLQAFGLPRAVAITDPAAEQALFVSVDAQQELHKTRVHTCRRPVRAIASPLWASSAGQLESPRLLTVCRGAEGLDRDRPDAEKPALVAIEDVQEAGGYGVRRREYQLHAPRTAVVVDPEKPWAVLYADPADPQQLIENPNEIVVVNLDSEAAPRWHSLRADAGGIPKRFSFAALSGVGGAEESRLLIVEREQDVALVDLGNPSGAELTARLTTNLDRVAPAGVVVTTPAQSADGAWVAIRQQTDQRAIVTLHVQRATDGSLKASPNILDAGGTPTDLAWVRGGSGGLKLAALLPSLSKAALIDPVTSDIELVSLQVPYARMSVVTVAAGGGAGEEIVLLWGGGVSSVPAGLWSLGDVAGQPYRSVQYLTGISGAVEAVTDLVARPELKLLLPDASGKAQTAHVLDLKSRQAAPLLLSSGRVSYVIDPTARRMWNFVPGQTELCVTELEMGRLSPRCDLRPDRGVDEAFEIQAGTAESIRALVALHLWQAPGVPRGSLGATVYTFDSEKESSPDPAARRIHSSLLTGGTLDETDGNR